jgi:hypothetical protein
MSFGFGRGIGDRHNNITVAMFAILIIVSLVCGIVAIKNGMPRALQTANGSATPDPVAVAESVGTTLYDGGDGRTTTQAALLPGNTGSSPEMGLIAGPDEAVNYLYYARTRRHIIVGVQGSGRTSPVLAVIGPDGGVLAHDENAEGDSTAEIRASLPAAGYYTIRVSANVVDPDARASNYSLNFAAPGYYSAKEWEDLLELAPVVIAILIAALGLSGRLFGVSVEKLIERLRWSVLLLVGVPRLPPGLGRNPPQTALVLPPPPEGVSEFEMDRDEPSADPIEGLYLGHYYEDDEADDGV